MNRRFTFPRQVACSECLGMFLARYTEALTCSAKCRKARSRRIKAESRQPRGRRHVQPTKGKDQHER